MKRNLKTKTLIVMIIMIMMMATVCTIVNAAELNYSVGMSLTSSSKLKAGDTVTIKVNLTSINAGEGIDTITAAINYDANVFEDITTADLTASNDWTPSYAASSKMLTLLKNSKVTSPETVLTIKLKVRDVINVNSTTVTLKEIVASGGRVTDGGTGDITVKDAPITLSKEQEAVTPTKPTTPSTTNNTIKDNTTTQKTTLPKTGIAQYSALAIVVVAIIAIASYVAYKKIAKDVK